MYVKVSVLRGTFFVFVTFEEATGALTRPTQKAKRKNVLVYVVDGAGGW